MEEIGEQFVVDSDEKAEWALNKLREIHAEEKRLSDTCKKMIARYQTELAEITESSSQDKAYFESLLIGYFNTVPHRETKTRAEYRLPTGRIRKHFSGLKTHQDNSALLDWLKENERTEFIKISESPMWGELKKTCTITPDGAVDENGQIVGGVRIEVTPEKYEVVLDD